MQYVSSTESATLCLLYGIGYIVLAAVAIPLYLAVLFVGLPYDLLHSIRWFFRFLGEDQTFGSSPVIGS
uniref:Transmembrane protein n=1 Tax=Steinernema glaseri TaxID=37863 RepID=A0A1I7ZQ28_9BILA